MYYNRWHQSINWTSIEIIIKASLVEKALFIFPGQLFENKLTGTEVRPN